MIATEMPLIVTKNMRQQNLFNDQECRINTFGENEAVVEDEEHNMITMKLSEFISAFYLFPHFVALYTTGQLGLILNGLILILMIIIIQ